MTTVKEKSAADIKKSKIYVILFLLFVVAVYIGGYFYDKAKNEVKIHYPRLVMFIQEVTTPDFKSADEVLISPEAIMAAFDKGQIVIITHKEYASGVTDVYKKYFDLKGYSSETLNGALAIKEIVDCIDLGAKIDNAKAPSQKDFIKRKWAHKICRMEMKAS